MVWSIQYSRRSVPINCLPDIPGVQRDSPRFSFPRATEVERFAIIKRSTAGSNLASCYLVPQRAEFPLKPIEHLTVIRYIRYTGSLCSFREKKYIGERLCWNHYTLEGTFGAWANEAFHRCQGKETTWELISHHCLTIIIKHTILSL